MQIHGQLGFREYSPGQVKQVFFLLKYVNWSCSVSLGADHSNPFKISREYMAGSHTRKKQMFAQNIKDIIKVKVMRFHVMLIFAEPDHTLCITSISPKTKLTF